MSFLSRIDKEPLGAKSEKILDKGLDLPEALKHEALTERFHKTKSARAIVSKKFKVNKIFNRQ